MPSKLYYIHDPMCSWCWGYRPVWDELQMLLPESVQVHYVVGGLAPDNDQPMPLAQQQIIQAHWRTIRQKLATEFNFDFWLNNTPRRSTYNACRAVLAAKRQGYEREMIDAIQRGYYLQAQNPSDISALCLMAETLTVQHTGFDVDLFKKDISSDEVEGELVAQIALARKLTQQGFPSLVLAHQDRYSNIAVNYLDAKQSIQEISALLNL